MSKVFVLGAGAAGMAAGYYLQKKGVKYTILEASGKVGGNAQTFWKGDMGYDSGAHRLHDVHEEITNEYHKILGEDITQIHSPSVIYSKSKFFDFPLSPLNIVRNLTVKELLKSVKTYLFREKGDGDFERLAIARYGKFIANKFLLGYTEKLWGVSCEQLSEQVAGKRLKGLDLKTFFKELFLSKKAKTTHLDGSFFYPTKGIGQLFDKMSEVISVELNTPVESIEVVDNKITKLTAGGQQYEVDKVVSSLPMPLLVQMMNLSLSDKIKESLQRLQFVDLYLVAIQLNKQSVTNNASLYFPDKETIFTRVVEPKNRSSALAPKGKTMLVAEVPVLSGISKEEEVLKQQTKAQLLETGLFIEKEIESISVKKIKYAYPVLTKEYQNYLVEIKELLSSIDNLYLTGRVANFTYQHIHDHFKEGQEIADEIANGK